MKLKLVKSRAKADLWGARCQEHLGVYPSAEPTKPETATTDLRGHGPHCYPWDWQYGDNEPSCAHRSVSAEPTKPESEAQR